MFGRVDMSTSASAQLPFLCAFHFFRSIGYLAYLLWDMSHLICGEEDGFGWLRQCAEEGSPPNTTSFFFVEMTTIGPLIAFTKSEGGTLQALYVYTNSRRGDWSPDRRSVCMLLPKP